MSQHEAGDQSSINPPTRKRRVALTLPGFAADEEDSCIPVLSSYVAALSRHAEVSVFTGGWPFRPGRYRLHGATILCTARGRTTLPHRIRAWIAVEREIARAAQSRPFDLLHAFWATAPGLAAVRTADRLGIPSIVSLGGGELAADRTTGYGSGLSPISSRVVRTVLKRADFITAGSRFLFDLLPAPFCGKAELYPLGIDVERFAISTKEPTQREQLRLLTVSSMIPVKDYPTMLRAIAIVRERGLPVTLTATGWTGNRQERGRVDRLIAELRLGDVIDLRGTVEHGRMPAIYREHDLLLQGSRHEAQGMAIIEGLASGLSVVSTPVGVAPEIVADSGDQSKLRLTPIGDPSSMADVIVATAGVMKTGRAEIERFSTEQVVASFLGLYERAINR